MSSFSSDHLLSVFSASASFADPHGVVRHPVHFAKSKLDVSHMFLSKTVEREMQRTKGKVQMSDASEIWRDKIKLVRSSSWDESDEESLLLPFPSDVRREKGWCCPRHDWWVGGGGYTGETHFSDKRGSQIKRWTSIRGIRKKRCELRLDYREISTFEERRRDFCSQVGSESWWESLIPFSTKNSGRRRMCVGTFNSNYRHV